MNAVQQAENDPEAYVAENKETLVRIIKHGDDRFVRSLCLAALVRWGDEPDIEDLRREIDNLDRLREGVA